MTTEENKRMLALAYVVADLNAENMELEQRVHQLMDEYNDVVRQLDGKETPSATIVRHGAQKSERQRLLGMGLRL